jgi:hypothetical protein
VAIVAEQQTDAAAGDADETAAANAIAILSAVKRGATFPFADIGKRIAVPKAMLSSQHKWTKQDADAAEALIKNPEWFADTVGQMGWAVAAGGQVTVPA